MKIKAHIPALCIAAILSFGPLAAPAGADLVPGNGQEGNSVLPSDPLGTLDDPLNPVVPGDQDLGDQIGDSLGDIPGIGGPKPKEQPVPEPTGSVDSAPQSSEPRTAPSIRVSTPKAKP